MSNDLNKSSESVEHPTIEEDYLAALDLKLKMNSVLKIKTEICSEYMEKIKKMNADYRNPEYLKFVKVESMNTYHMFEANKNKLF